MDTLDLVHVLSTPSGQKVLKAIIDLSGFLKGGGSPDRQDVGRVLMNKIIEVAPQHLPSLLRKERNEV